MMSIASASFSPIPEYQAIFQDEDEGQISSCDAALLLHHAIYFYLMKFPEEHKFSKQIFEKLMEKGQIPSQAFLQDAILQFIQKLNKMPISEATEKKETNNNDEEEEEDHYDDELLFSHDDFVETVVTLLATLSTPSTETTVGGDSEDITALLVDAADATSASTLFFLLRFCDVRQQLPSDALMKKILGLVDTYVSKCHHHPEFQEVVKELMPEVEMVIDTENLSEEVAEVLFSIAVKLKDAAGILFNYTLLTMLMENIESVPENLVRTIAELCVQQVKLTTSPQSNSSPHGPMHLLLWIYKQQYQWISDFHSEIPELIILSMQVAREQLHNSECRSYEFIEGTSVEAAGSFIHHVSYNNDAQMMEAILEKAISLSSSTDERIVEAALGTIKAITASKPGMSSTELAVRLLRSKISSNATTACERVQIFGLQLLHTAALTETTAPSLPEDTIGVVVHSCLTPSSSEDLITCTFDTVGKIRMRYQYTSYLSQRNFTDFITAVCETRVTSANAMVVAEELSFMMNAAMSLQTNETPFVPKELFTAIEETFIRLFKLSTNLIDKENILSRMRCTPLLKHAVATILKEELIPSLQKLQPKECLHILEVISAHARTIGPLSAPLLTQSFMAFVDRMPLPERCDVLELYAKYAAEQSWFISKVPALLEEVTGYCKETSAPSITVLLCIARLSMLVPESTAEQYAQIVLDTIHAIKPQARSMIYAILAVAAPQYTASRAAEIIPPLFNVTPMLLDEADSTLLLRGAITLLQNSYLTRSLCCYTDYDDIEDNIQPITNSTTHAVVVVRVCQWIGSRLILEQHDRRAVGRILEHFRLTMPSDTWLKLIATYPALEKYQLSANALFFTDSHSHLSDLTICFA